MSVRASIIEKHSAENDEEVGGEIVRKGNR